MVDDRSTLSRREFVKGAGGAAAASLLSLVPTGLHAGATARRRYAIVGTGVRACHMWGSDLLKTYGDTLEFVGLCDPNPLRVEAAKKRMGVDCPTFTDFNAMCDRAKPDLLMVCTTDCFHSEYIVKGLDRGLDVMTEKPMVIDETQCQAVVDAEKRAGKKIVVTFNYRFAPKQKKIKEILVSGAIGDVVSVDFAWYLDTNHGAEYFRRWHRLKSRSGSLFVHKATHHFDLVNWWLDADPVDVTAFGELRHYGRNGAFRHTHCRTCPHKEKCPFFWDITKDERAMELYAGCESADGYLRDGCIFREDVDIYDTMTAVVKYSNRAVLSYSLNAAMPYEGYRVAFNGTRGRLEVRDHERQPWEAKVRTEVHLTKNFGGHEAIEVPKGVGGHGGGDVGLKDLIFRPELAAKVPAWLRLPDSRAGAMSCLTGIAARKSVEERRGVKIAELVRM